MIGIDPLLPSSSLLSKKNTQPPSPAHPHRIITWRTLPVRTFTPGSVLPLWGLDCKWLFPQKLDCYMVLSSLASAAYVVHTPEPALTCRVTKLHVLFPACWSVCKFTRVSTKQTLKTCLFWCSVSPNPHPSHHALFLCYWLHITADRNGVLLNFFCSLLSLGT